MRRLLPVVLCVLLLCGCEAPSQEPAVRESLLWEEAPKLEHGVLEYEQLAAEPWYCGRLEFTSGNRWAETELGYYYYDSGFGSLYYADKANLDNWVPVCGKPYCQHTFNVLGCNAHLGWNTFYIRDGRIHYMDNAGGKNEVTFVSEDLMGMPIFCSRALNGTDHRVDHVLELPASTGQSGFSMVYNPQHLLINYAFLDIDGSRIHRFYRVTGTDMEILAELTDDSGENMIYVCAGGTIWVDGMPVGAFAGDDTFSNDLVSKLEGHPLFTMYRFRDGKPEMLDIDGYERTGRYLSGNTLRLYRENDGYYDLDLTTREETFVAPARTSGGDGRVFLPNCTVEIGEDGRQWLFDGLSWREIIIPEEYQDVPLSLCAVASDRIFFLHRVGTVDVTDIFLYQIPLGQEQLVLEYCGQIF